MKRIVLPKELSEKGIIPVSYIKDTKGRFVKCIQNVNGEYKILYLNEIKADMLYEKVDKKVSNYLIKKYKRDNYNKYIK